MRGDRTGCEGKYHPDEAAQQGAHRRYGRSCDGNRPGIARRRIAAHAGRLRAATRLMNSRVYDATNFVGLVLIGAGVWTIFGAGPALVVVGVIAIMLNLINAFFGRRRVG